ncbi:MAG: hypothetical protein MJE77_08705 [Proteobacteria bacterium]|nr:hypothetical protein [Pseudomonadota bacterium]
MFGNAAREKPLRPRPTAGTDYDHVTTHLLGRRADALVDNAVEHHMGNRNPLRRNAFLDLFEPLAIVGEAFPHSSNMLGYRNRHSVRIIERFTDMEQSQMRPCMASDLECLINGNLGFIRKVYCDNDLVEPHGRLIVQPVGQQIFAPTSR